MQGGDEGERKGEEQHASVAGSGVINTEFAHFLHYRFRYCAAEDPQGREEVMGEKEAGVALRQVREFVRVFGILLGDLGMCVRCCMRVTRINIRQLYCIEPEEDLLERIRNQCVQFIDAKCGGSSRGEGEREEIKKLARDMNMKEGKPVCFLCVGCLTMRDSFMRHLREDILNQGFALEHIPAYQIKIELPISVSVRGFSLFCHLREERKDIANSGFLSGIQTFNDFLDCIIDLKDAYKMMCDPEIRQELNVTYVKEANFSIVVRMEHAPSEGDHKFLLTLPDSGVRVQQKRRRGPEIKIANSTIEKGLQTVGYSVVKKHIFIPCRPPAEPCKMEVRCAHASMYVAGRYNKYSREMSQTPWVIDGVRKSATSVEELSCARIVTRVKGEPAMNGGVLGNEEKENPVESSAAVPGETCGGSKFSSSGREDFDVMMLGSGRPFVLEIVNPRVPYLSSEILGELQKEINKSTDKVQVRDLQVVSKADVTKNMKDVSFEKKKTYVAKIWTENPITEDIKKKIAEVKDLMVSQKTPIRVLHRRTQMYREKIIHWMKIIKSLNPHEHLLELCSSSGTYIKEFVHGDLGRTNPSLMDIMPALGECDISQLDVMHIHLDWPAQVDHGPAAAPMEYEL
eukprot:Nk52_evm25s2356 gene=Nk52_evmTU25s2356